MVGLPCEQARGIRGLYVTTRSTDGAHPVCNLSSRTDVRHVVIVENLMTYPVEIKCAGEIHATPRKVRFSSPYPTDTDSKWEASTLLEDGDVYSFDSVTLLRVTPGTERVAVYVSAEWSASGKAAT